MSASTSTLRAVRPANRRRDRVHQHLARIQRDLPSVAGRMRWTPFGSLIVGELKGGCTVVIRDVRTIRWPIARRHSRPTHGCRSPR